MINGVSELIMTKSDILNDFDEVKACVGYSYPHSFQDGGQYGGVEFLYSYRYDNSIYGTEGAKPLYKVFKGWNTVSNKEPLEDFIKFIESEVGVKVTIVSTGKERDDLYLR
jgi:adenylosuccinate synthase